MSVADRKALREAIHERFNLLRLDVERRRTELVADVKKELVEHYRRRDEAVREAMKEVDKLTEDYWRAVRELRDKLTTEWGDLDVTINEDAKGRFRIEAKDKKRAAAEDAINAKIPAIVADANLQLRRAENDMMIELTALTLDTDEAKQFLSKLPTVAQLVPSIRMAQLVSGVAVEPASEPDGGYYADDDEGGY
jgi:hypothetical protein